jgi:hypothetical protein
MSFKDKESAEPESFEAAAVFVENVPREITLPEFGQSGRTGSKD